MNKESLTQSYQLYPRAQFSDQFYLMFFGKIVLAKFASTLKNTPILESECEAAINWLHNNKMIVNPTIN